MLSCKMSAIRAHRRRRHQIHQLVSAEVLGVCDTRREHFLWIIEPSGHSQANDAGPVELDVDKQRCEVLPILIRI